MTDYHNPATQEYEKMNDERQAALFIFFPAVFDFFATVFPLIPAAVFCVEPAENFF